MVPERVKKRIRARFWRVVFVAVFCLFARSRSFLSLIPRCLRMSSTEKMEKKQCHEVYARQNQRYSHG
ncbi:hypothetical protein ECDEC6E_5324 [Escherichia coli DEC6E]|nr:hypothetical protein ECDEC6E_5324 [Escherichia coli DEC6E]